jgi:pilus assembly protein CpaB
MRAVFALVLVLGLGLAGFAVYMAQGYMAQMSAERDRLLAAQRAAPPTVRVFVVTEPRAYGERLTREHVKTVIWQKDSLPDGAFTDEAALFPEGAPDRFVVRRMERFEPVLAAKVTAPGEDAGITSRLSPGMRAFAIRVDVSSGVSGFLRPGDRVDVYWTGQVGTGGPLGGEVTKLIESNMQLIAVDQIADTERSAPVIARTVTVEATPQEVAALAQAQSTGSLSLSLVGAEDNSVAEVVQVDQRSLLGIVEKEKEVVVEEEVCTTKIRRGAEVMEQQIPCTN